MTNEQLVARIQAGENTAENMLQLWQQTKAFVAKLAKKYKGYAEFDDLMQEGYLGLSEAVNHYDVSQHIPFINYAAYWIKQRMQRFTERASTVRLPSDMYQSVMKYRRIVGEYTKMYNRDPSDYELRGLLDVSREELTRIQENAKRRCDHELMSKALWDSVKNLPEKQALVIIGRYQDKRTHESLGHEMGCSFQYSRYLEQKALRTLRRPHISRKFQTYHEQYLTPYPIHHIGIESFQRTGFSEVERAVLGWRD